MSDLLGPELPELPRVAVDLLAAIRDHLNLPLYQEGSKKDRREYVDLLQVRHADVVAVLNDLLSVPLSDVVERTEELREFAAELPVRYRTSDHPNGGL